ncbi:hypothetical protein [Sulfuritalea hydrogenivorans]|jgi:hypothetical protein|uniref:Uncharacterized protein n=1 Tax=Sulfuritalea hydrogenivorans sk43H TaxID=1223802 RepID=W0SHT7_9PROT|nr:hypothetical protein [Sulfuritalea hydrogenivorans]MDK9715613.1 hypothetical protein [Sulfuritalea sp.]BAO29493.1 hypothetical protein SUTH_01700 [Sulfuritalea hydrogenivorans sk43H]
MKKLSMVLLLAAASSLAIAEQMVWKVVSSSGMVSATVFNDLRACKKALPNYRKGSTCVAVPLS